MTLRALMVTIVMLSMAGVATAQDTSSYAGMESREIKALSKEDIAELERGGGWGLALPAELNGVPGPAHLLELADEIPLSDAQVSEIEEIHAAMREDAIEEGETLLALEAELEAGFRDGTITDAELRDLTQRAAASRGRLRYVHLSRHLMTVPLLSEEQIARYRELRGYETSDACDEVPEGHHSEMWWRHNDCD